MPRVIFHSTNERSHWIKDNISNPYLNNSMLLKNVNLNNSILLKSVSYCYLYCLLSNGICTPMKQNVNDVRKGPLYDCSEALQCTHFRYPTDDQFLI